MKFVKLLISLILVVSCSHHSKRFPANGDDEHYIRKYNEETVRYLLSYKPKSYGSFESLMSTEREEFLYRLIGDIDLGKKRPVHSRLLGRGVGFKNLINLSNVRQVSFESWQSMKEEVGEAFRRGDYVFQKGPFFYTLSGLKLTVRNIDDRIFTAARRYFPNLDIVKLALDIFNRRTLFVAGENSGAFVIPTGVYVDPRILNHISDDFRKQVGGDIELSPVELINYGHKVGLDLKSD
jgi:hypothetical protein